MSLSEDIHPLLYVYTTDDHPKRLRSRWVSQGASNLLGKWPDHLTFSWMMNIIGLLSLLSCFLLAVILLMASKSEQLENKIFPVGKCLRNEHVIEIVHMKSSEDMTPNESATYIIELNTNKNLSENSLCSVESYVKHTTLPVFLISIFPNNSLNDLNLSSYIELEKKFKNFKTITFDLNLFFNKTIFSYLQTQDPKLLSFLAKLLISWNVGGTVLDSSMLTLKDFKNTLEANDSNITTVIIGSLKGAVSLIKTQRFCHAYLFEILKTITESKNILDLTEYEIIRLAQERFCSGNQNCKGIKLISSPDICNFLSINENCTFLFPQHKDYTLLKPIKKRICPITTTLI